MRHYSFVLIVLLATLFFSCKKETQPAEENDNELITTVRLEFKNRTTQATTSFIWEDSDGPGGTLPFKENINLDVNTVYDVTVSFLNKAVDPTENLTDEVVEESENHRIYYDPSAGLGVTIDQLNNDTKGVPLGISSVWTTSTANTGTIAVVLIHYAEGGKEIGDQINSTKGTTDAGAIFNVTVGAE